jgi:hypothetical protein
MIGFNKVRPLTNADVVYSSAPAVNLTQQHPLCCVGTRGRIMPLLEPEDAPLMHQRRVYYIVV